MSLRPFKFIVQAVLTEHDEEGNVVGERQAEPVALYGVDKLTKWAEDFDGQLAAAQARPG